MAVKKSPPKTKAKIKKSKPTELAEVSQSQEKESTRTGIKFYEAGTSGLPSWSGFVSQAYLAALSYPQCYTEFNRIWQSMPEMRMAKNVFSTWGRQVRPVIRLGEDANDDDKQAQEYYYQMLDDIDGGFAKLLDTYLIYTPFFGVEWLEAPMAIRDPKWVPPKDIDGEPDEWRSQYDDGLIGIRRFSHRSMAVFYKWDLTEKGKKLKGIWQQDFPNPPTRLDINNSLHLTVGDPTSPEGLAGLIPAYRLERLKYGYEVVLGIGSERGAGYLKVNRTDNSTLSSGDMAAIAEAAKNIQSAQEGNYGYVPYGLEMNLVDTPFSAAGTILETIKLYSLLSLSIYNLQFIGLNTLTSTGALASVSDASAMAVLGFNGLLDNFSQQFDNQIMKRLWKVNNDPKGMNAWPNATARPHFEITHLDKEIALAELSQFITAMDGILTLGTDDMKAIRKRSGFLPEEEPSPEDVIISAVETRKLDQKAAEAKAQPAEEKPEEKKPADKEKAEMAELEWDEAKHPRDPQGTGTGGHFTNKSGAASSDIDRAHEMGKTLIDQLKAGGFSESLAGKSPTSGYMTATSDKSEWKTTANDVTSENIADYAIQYNKELHGENTYLGGWLNKDDDGITRAYLDVSTNYQSLEETIRVARASNQKGIYDVTWKDENGMGRTIYVNDPSGKPYWMKGPEGNQTKTWL